MKIIRSFPTKKRKPLFCALLLFLLVALMLTSCARETDYTTETDEAGYPNETLLARIEEDFSNLQYENGANREIDGPFKVAYCYGMYRDCVPVMFSGMASADVLWDDVVAEIVFHYTDGRSIEVWKNGDFYSLQEAYDEGLLTKEHLQSIADIQNEWYTDEN